MNTEVKAAPDELSDRAIAQAFREECKIVFNTVAVHRVIKRAKGIDAANPPAGARDAVTDALEELAVRFDKRDQWMRTKTAPNLGLADAFKDAAADIRALTGKADGWEAMTKAAMDLKMRHVDNHQGDIYHALQSLIVKFGKPWDGKLTEATQSAATGAGEYDREMDVARVMRELTNTAAPGMGELPELPQPFEIEWPELHRQGLGCGVEDRGLTDRYECAEYGWQDGVDRAAECVPEQIYTAGQMRDYAKAALAAQPAPSDEQYASPEALIDHLDGLADDGGQGGEKWEPAQAAIAGIRAWQVANDWFNGRPSVPGIYKVRGFHIGHPEDYAVVEVIRRDGELLTNLHECNSDRDRWRRVENVSDKFEWLRVDTPAQPAPVDARDYAIEHAEYMAVDAERLIESINKADRLRDECDQSVGSIDEVEAAYATRGDCMTGLQSAIYEFRKRRDRQTAQPAPVVGGDGYVEQHARDSKELRRLCESRDFYKRRCDALQAVQSNMRDPERKAVCDILANGSTELLAARPGGEGEAGFYLASFRSKGCRGAEVLWWAPNNAGYTTDLEQAGIYTEITPGYHDSEHTVPVPVSFIRGLRVRRAVDPGDSLNGMFWSAEKLRAALAAHPAQAGGGRE